MSDQETKPEAVDVPMAETEVKAEAVEAPVETTEATATEEKPAETQSAEVKTETRDASTKKPALNMLKVKRPEKVEKGKSHSKFDVSDLPETSDPELIRRQVQFYFSDSNLPTDKFLSGLTGLGENKAVPLKTITSFKRMRRFQPYSAVVAALKDSKELEVEGAEGEETIKRKKAFDPSRRQKIDERSVYVKGFGEETPSTQFDIEAFFAQYGETNSVRLRRGDDQGFKGSVFVEFADQETADKFLALDPKPKWKEHDLLIMPKLEYVEQKNKEIREGKREPSDSRHRGRGGFKGGRGGSDNWKDRRDRDQRNGHRDQRGGRGRGRGGRGRGRDHGGPRRDQEDKPKAPTGDGRPKIHTSEDKPADANAGEKRAREGEATEAPPAKKVDTKESAPAESS
ncbi:hypothetical protein G7054_g4316 [Neopestalotiopsis clavispora]|nr:hypothetical protein G7054_g4316 [Neopestalotiopsis clavispora]